MIIDLYKSILNYSGMEADEEGFINIKYGDDSKPFHIDGKSAVLPTNEQLKSFNDGEKFLFHPLAENILEKGEPLVIRKLKDAINVKLNYTTGIVCQALLNIIVSPDLHKRLNSDQSELLTLISDADNKTLENFTQQMLSRMKKDPAKVFTSIYLKKGGMLNGKKYGRLAVVMFPFYEDLESAKVRKKDKLAFKKLFEYIFSEIDNSDFYNVGSTTRTAPYLDALMLGSMSIASRLNDVLAMFEEHIDESESLMFDSNWYESFQDLDELLPMIRRIPSHPSLGVTEEVEQVNVQQQFQQQQQQQQNTQVIPPPQVLVPVAQQQFQQQPPQLPELKANESGNLDFKSVLAVRPDVAYAPNPIAGIAAQENHELAMKQYHQQIQSRYQQQPLDARNNQPLYPQQPIDPRYQQQPMYPQQPLPRAGWNQY